MAVDKLVDSAQLDSDLASVANAIRAKSGGQAQLSFPTEFISEIGNIPSGGGGVDPDSDVLFIDYDGTALYGYSAAEFAQLSELPANPTHEGLTAQGWNWTKAQITAQLTAVPDGQVVVGQMYITQSGNTEIDIEIPGPRLTPSITINILGSVTVDWGDNSQPETKTANTWTSTQYFHTYSAGGNYTISVIVPSGSYVAFTATTTRQFFHAAKTTLNENMVYASCVKRVRTGGYHVQVSEYAFANCYNLESVVISSSAENTQLIGKNAFDNCYALKSIVMPNHEDIFSSSGTYICEACYSLETVSLPPSISFIPNTTFYACRSLKRCMIPYTVEEVGSSVFSSCYLISEFVFPDSVEIIGSGFFNSCTALSSVRLPSSLTSLPNTIFNSVKGLHTVALPSGITAIGSSSFYGCSSLEEITIPSLVTSIGNQAFYQCYALKEMHFMPTTPPTVTNSNVFTSIPTTCTIYVPTGSLSAYKSATNYPNPSTYTYVEE